ncbi:hypothetical protein E2562_007003 [Oryza meyeriana var. granulata]|uniref:Uncharacterized protein n=1 Tax=Oryza meyeriana var. granulata TaxID=110450 RepID=A0A6G1E9I5_9ORYZ|nr:hypothetical protein E2562_007003 [Oryza meyeriana var. granulata]
MAAILGQASSLGIWGRCSSPKSQAGGDGRLGCTGGGGGGDLAMVEHVAELATVEAQWRSRAE